MGKLAEGAKAPPLILVVSPREGWETEANAVALSGVIQDDQGLEALEISINDEKLKTYWIGVDPLTGQDPSKRLEFQERVPLRKGDNQIKINAVDVEGFYAEKIITETRRLLDDPQEHALMSLASNPYGDGHAAQRIVKAILEYTEKEPGDQVLG